MAGVTIGRRATVVAVGMARDTIHRRVESRKREGSSGMVETWRCPCSGVVTGRAGVTNVI